LKRHKYYFPFRLAPQVKIVDGKIILNEESLYIRHGSDISTVDIIRDAGQHITSATYLTREPSDKWNYEETEKFYKVRGLCIFIISTIGQLFIDIFSFQALNYWGTDFSLISRMFTNRTRKQIKHKYKREERMNPARLQHALTHRKSIDPKELATMMPSFTRS
jgi:transcription factor TFIIIB component B''